MSDTIETLRAEHGAVGLQEYCLRVAGREWRVLHTDAILTPADEARFLHQMEVRLPYGVALWPAAIALAHEVAERAEALRGRRVLELGAGTGLPGIVAASLGAHVVQTDRHELALSMAVRNAARNHAPAIEQRLADWVNWSDDARYDWIIGSDILYGESLHPHLRRIFEANLAPGGRILLADPFRATSLALLEALERDGWSVRVSTWSVGEEDAPRQIGLFELAAPH